MVFSLWANRDDPENCSVPVGLLGDEPITLNDHMANNKDGSSRNETITRNEGVFMPIGRLFITWVLMNLVCIYIACYKWDSVPSSTTFSVTIEWKIGVTCYINLGLNELLTSNKRILPSPVNS